MGVEGERHKQMSIVYIGQAGRRAWGGGGGRRGGGGGARREERQEIECWKWIFSFFGNIKTVF